MSSKRHKHRRTNNCEIVETYIPVEAYDEIRDLPGVPNLEDFPNGIYILGLNNFARTIGYFPESQLAKMEEIAKLEAEARRLAAKEESEQEIAVAP